MFASDPSTKLRLRLAAASLALVATSIPFLAIGWAEKLPAELADVQKANAGDAFVLREATGIPDDELASLRQHLHEDGRLVLWYPFDTVPEDAKGTLTEMLESRVQLYRNLLYPRPREARMARDPAELRSWISPELRGKLLVVDLLQQDGQLPDDGVFELVHERRVGVRVRHWLLREVGK